jgi:hypothetical protein
MHAHVAVSFVIVIAFRAQVSIIEPGFLKTAIVTGAASMLQRMADNLPAATRARYTPDFIERAIGSASKVYCQQSQSHSR